MLFLKGTVSPKFVFGLHVQFLNLIHVWYIKYSFFKKPSPSKLGNGTKNGCQNMVNGTQFVLQNWLAEQNCLSKLVKGTKIVWEQNFKYISYHTWISVENCTWSPNKNVGDTVPLNKWTNAKLLPWACQQKCSTTQGSVLLRDVICMDKSWLDTLNSISIIIVHSVVE
jgi:hypothetical protein